MVFFPVKPQSHYMGPGRILGGSPDHTSALEMGVVNVPFKTTSSELDRVSKKDIIKEVGGPRDVKTQTQVSKKVM